MTPTVAMSIPPSAGPAIMPTLPRKVLSAAAAGISPGSTSRGVIASSEGRCRPLRADMKAAAAT